MNKFYRVIKENPLWEIGAILKNTSNNGGYTPVEDFWNLEANKPVNEYLTAGVVEHSPLYFERVYPDGLNKIAYKTVDEMKKLYSGFVS